MKTINNIARCGLSLLIAGSIGCGQTLRPYVPKGVDQSLSVEADDSMAKAEQAAKEAQIAIKEVEALIATITDEDGNINVGLFKKASQADVSSKALLEPIISKLREVFDKLFAKVYVVKQQFQTARQALNEALAKIDQSNPATAAQVAMIMAELAKIDQLEAAFSTSMHSLASKLDLAIAGLDAVIKGVVTFIPGWGSIVGLALDFLVMGDIKALILELKAKLMAL